MSSAGITYRVVSESVLREQAEQRLRQLASRARRMSQRCVAAGLPELAVADARSLPNSTAINAECARLEAVLGETESAVQAAHIRRRAQQINRELAATLSDLASRENAAAPARQVAAPAAVDTADAERRQRLTYRVQRMLATLLEPSPELERAGIAVCRTTDRARGELLLSHLDSRIAVANAATRRAREGHERLSQLRDAAAELGEPGGAGAVLDRAAQALARGRDATADLRLAGELIESRSALEHDARNRGFVLAAVGDALAELGYTAMPVAMDTAGSIVLSAPGSATLGVRACIVNGEIDIRTVRTPADCDTAAAEAAVCADLGTLADGLRARGVEPDRLRQSPPGLASVQTVPAEQLAADRAVSAERPVSAERAARKARRERSSEA
ncbi:hypothetical protein [Nocardia sp. NPDC004722]